MEHMNLTNTSGQKLKLNQILLDFETPRDARERKKTLVKHLKAGNRAMRRAGRKLRKCRRKNCCNSPICPRCVRKQRRSFIKGGMACIDQVRTANGIPD